MYINKKIGRRILRLLGAVVILELLLQIGCTFLPSLNFYLSPLTAPDDVARQQRDSHLYQRPTHEFSGHDFRGFRNSGILRRANIVAMGDSQTYGMGSPIQDAWPQQLEFLSNQTVYNISFGGWGPIQYGYLWKEALALQPHTVVIGFHTPDFIDCSLSVYRRGLRREFKTADTDPFAFLVEKEILPAIEKRIAGLFTLSPDCAKVHEQQKNVQETPFVFPPAGDPIPPTRNRWSILKIHRLPRAIDRALFDNWRPYYRWIYRRSGDVRERMPATMMGKPAPPFRKPKVYSEPLRDYFRDNVPTEDVQWVTMIPKRSLEADITNPFVSEGLRIAVELFKDLQLRADDAGVRLMIALLPTKELAFSSFLFNDYEDELPRDYRKLVARETFMRTLLEQNLRENGVETVDVLPGLQACFQNEKLPYPLIQDSHPTQYGYRAIARQVRDALERPTAENRAILDVDWDRLVKDADPASGHSLPTRTLVKARIIEKSSSPTVASIFPYKSALVTHLYQVEKTLWGQNPGKQILVAHWSIRDGEVLPEARKKHRIYDLTLEPFANHPHLAREFMVDETSVPEAPLFYDVLSDPKPAATEKPIPD